VDSNILAGLIVVADRALFHPDVEVKNEALTTIRDALEVAYQRWTKGATGARQ
jgi:hypothetical protein